MNGVEENMHWLSSKDRIVFHMTFEDFNAAINSAIESAMKRHFDEYRFWEKYPDLMTTKEACEALSIGRSKLKDLTDQNTILKHSIDGMPRYKKQELFEYVESTNHFSLVRMKRKKRADGRRKKAS